MPLSDKEIKELVLQHEMINPFFEQLNTSGLISYGLSSYGYDVRTSDEFYIFTNVNSVIIDPKNFDKQSMVKANLNSDETGTFIVIPPNSFALTCTEEYIKMPRNITGFMMVKSTYARCGIVSPPTVLEAEWQGHITIEISNTTPLPAKIYANEGIAQVVFFKGDKCDTSYLDRNGKYQNQRGVTLPKVIKGKLGEQK